MLLLGDATEGRISSTLGYNTEQGMQPLGDNAEGWISPMPGVSLEAREGPTPETESLNGRMVSTALEEANSGKERNREAVPRHVHVSSPLEIPTISIDSTGIRNDTEGRLLPQVYSPARQVQVITAE